MSSVHDARLANRLEPWLWKYAHRVAAEVGRTDRASSVWHPALKSTWDRICGLVS
jgi:hypothetical protein